MISMSQFGQKGNVAVSSANGMTTAPQIDTGGTYKNTGSGLGGGQKNGGANSGIRGGGFGVAGGWMQVGGGFAGAHMR